MGIYDLFGGSNNRAYTSNSWVENQKALREQAFADADKCCGRIKESGAELSKYLTVQARFDRYSVTNALLVSMNRSNATQLKDEKGWRNAGAYVEENQKPLIILEPGREYMKDDGTRGTYYNPKEVYDISQTTIRDSAEEKQNPSAGELVTALIKASPVEFQPQDDMDVAAFYDRDQGVIFVKKGLTETQLVLSMAKETATAFYDLKKKMGREESDFNSYCVAYMIGSKYGLNVSGFNFDKLPESYAGMENRDFRQELNTIRAAFSDIQIQMDKSLDRNKAEPSYGGRW